MIISVDFNNSKIQGDHKATYPAVAVKDEDGIGVEDNKYIGKPCFVLCESQQIPGKVAFTIGDIRGGYRDVANVPDYKDGCANGNYLKKEALKDNPFYEILANQEIPVCPFVRANRHSPTFNNRSKDKNKNAFAPKSNRSGAIAIQTARHPATTAPLNAPKKKLPLFLFVCSKVSAI